jgi:carbon starvation protein
MNFPAVNHTAADLPSIFPFLFITVACGAISGFHNLVSSGTTARQINNMNDARGIGYGGMLAEAMLGVLAVVASVVGLTINKGLFDAYASFESANKLGINLNVFIEGAAYSMTGIGIPHKFGATLISVIIVAFGMTTLDSGTRLLRFNFESIGKTLKIKPMENRYLASLLAVLAIGYFAFMKIGGQPAGLSLWLLFGTTNQLLAALGLLTVSVYLFFRKRPTLFVIIPMVFILVVTVWAMILNIKTNLISKTPSIPFITISGLILLIALWLVIEAIIAYKKLFKGENSAAELRIENSK